MGRISTTINFIITALFFFISTPVNAQLKLESAYPTLGLIGQDLAVEVTGSGFDTNTRVSMFPDSGNSRAIIGSNDTLGNCNDIAVKEAYAYITGGTYDLQVVDISNSSSPQLTGYLEIESDYFNGVAVTGDYIVAASGSGLYVIDVSTPSSPQQKGYKATPGYAADVAVEGDYAYVANDDEGLQVIDISNPSSPDIVGDTPLQGGGYANGVAVEGDYAYVVGSICGLQVIDISNPLNPFITGYTDGDFNFDKVTVQGDYAYVTDGYAGGLRVIDISNPSAPQIMGWVGLPGYSTEYVAISGNYVYVADEDCGIQIIDISNPSSPQVIGTVSTIPNYAYGIALSGSYAYVAGDNGLQVINISSLLTFQFTGNVYTEGFANNIAVSGNYAYVAESWVWDGDEWVGGLEVIDISNPSHPVLTGIELTQGNAYGVAIAEKYAYVTDDGNGLQVVDITDPSGPEIIGSASTGCVDVAVSGDYAYVAAEFNGLVVINISKPSAPVEITSVATGSTSYAVGVVVEGNYAYVADTYNGFLVIDITTPSAPKKIANPYTGIAYGLAVSGNYAYVAGGFEGPLTLIDISKPSNPVVKGMLYEETPGWSAHGITTAGNLAYVIDYYNGIRVFDISNPLNSHVLGLLDTPGLAYSVAVAGDYAYVSDGDWGLVIMPQPVEIEVPYVSGDTRTLTLPGPLYSGIYTLRAFNETEESELFGAVSFTDDPSVLNSKAIIVAGGGPEASGGTMWEETKLNANKAYDSLILQGYEHDSIYYISEETLNDYVDNDDPETFLSDLSYAINTWAADASQVLIYFVDHGQEDEFVLHEDNDTTITLDANILDDWLDTLQETMTGPVIFVYDACDSGAFISRLRPNDGEDRFVITATSDEPAYFLEDGKGSFSFQFWDRITQNDGNLGDAFLYAKDGMHIYQSALIEADWDYEGINNEEGDINIATDKTIQRGGYAYLGVHPFVGSVSDPQFLSSGTSATIQARGIIDSDSIEALIIPPDVNPETSGIPVTDLDTIPLTDGDGDHVFTGTYYSFDTEGTYTIIVKSQAAHDLYSYVSGTTTTQTLYSSPLYTSVTKTSGIQGIEPDTYEEDDSYSQANFIVLNDDDSQAHNFHDVGDADWVKFYGISEEIYKIKAYNTGIVCDPSIEVYDNDGTTLLLGPINDKAEGEDESLEWTCPEEGIYYIKITNANTNFGENVRYELKVYRPILGVPGDLTGIVFNPLGAGIGNAVIKSSVGNGTAVTDNDGYYLMVLPSGTHTITVTPASGYAENSQDDVVIEAEGSTALNFEMAPLDSDDDGLYDYLEDIIGTDPADPDTDDDGILDGVEDANHNGIIDAGETDPTKSDTDNDGIADGVEDANHNGIIDTGETDPTKSDTDNDGIADGVEDANHNGIIDTGETDPTKSDTDGDGIADGVEDANHNGTIDTGETDPTKSDTDGDGDSDGDEVLYGSDPLLASDTIDDHRPLQPAFSSDTAFTDVALSYHVFKVETYTDPDGDALVSSWWQISTDEGFSQLILDKTLNKGTGIINEDQDALILTMTEPLFLAGTDYCIRVRLSDSTGLWSAWSDPVQFDTTDIDSDLDDNGVDDAYQVDGDTDLNANSVNDADEDILAITDAEQGKSIGVKTDKGDIGGLTSLSTLDVDTDMADIDMPYGLFSFRIDGISAGETVDMTFYFPETMPSTTKWYKVNSADGVLLDYTSGIDINGKEIVLTITDGGSGDADNTANAIIIDPSGPAFTQEADTGDDTDTGDDADTGDDTDDGTIDTDDDGGDGGGGGGGGGIFGAIDIDDVIGYHFDGITGNGIRIYMPVTRGYKALKGAQTHVENVAPALANLIRTGFDSLERIAEANKDGILYKIGTHAFPVLGKIAELYLDCVGAGELMENAYSETMIEVSEFDKQHHQGIAISPHVVKDTNKEQK